MRTNGFSTIFIIVTAFFLIGIGYLLYKYNNQPKTTVTIVTTPTTPPTTINPTPFPNQEKFLFKSRRRDIWPDSLSQGGVNSVIEKDPSKYLIKSNDGELTTFKNSNITFQYDPRKFYIEYRRLNNPMNGPANKQTQLIDIVDINNKYELAIELNLDGVGGACPDFPKEYSLGSFNLDGKAMIKAKFIDGVHPITDHWPVGNIYIIEGSNNCPNVAGMDVANAPANVIYLLNYFPLDSKEFVSAEKELDTIVNSIKNFW